MQVTGIRGSVLAGVAVLGCLLVSQAALGVIAISSTERVYASGDPLHSDGGDLGFTDSRDGPNLGSFQGSCGDLAVKDGASASASASIDFDLDINAEAGTIAGTLVGAAASEFTGGGAGPGGSTASSDLYLVFSVPEGELGVYRLRGSTQWGGGSSGVLLTARCARK